MEIIKTKPGDQNFHFFENIPEQLYPVNSIRHKQAESINMEFLVACYVLTLNGEVKARAALYNNPHLVYDKKRSFCIGNYESVNDLKVSEKLMNFIVSEARKSGADFLIGPMNGSTWDNYRFSVHHQHANFLLEPYHHLYYNEHFFSSGFKTISNYTSSIDKDLHHDHPNVLKLDINFLQAGLTIRNIDMSNYERELKKLYPFISSAFKNNFLYTPISWEAFYKKYMEAAKIINPEYVLIAEDVQRNIKGFIFCYDDLLSKNEKKIVIKTIAREKSKELSGLGHAMANRILQLVKNRNYQSIIHAFMIEQGTSTGVSENFFGTIYKNYALYGKEI